MRGGRFLTPWTYHFGGLLSVHGSGLGEVNRTLHAFHAVGEVSGRVTEHRTDEVCPTFNRIRSTSFFVISAAAIYPSSPRNRPCNHVLSLQNLILLEQLVAAIISHTYDRFGIVILDRCIPRFVQHHKHQQHEQQCPYQSRDGQDRERRCVTLLLRWPTAFAGCQ